MKYWEIIADNLSKAAWSWGGFQPLILRGERSGLWTHTATTEPLSLCDTKSDQHLANYDEQLSRP
jgi:hypothetical protein